MPVKPTDQEHEYVAKIVWMSSGFSTPVRAKSMQASPSRARNSLGSMAVARSIEAGPELPTQTADLLRPVASLRKALS